MKQPRSGATEAPAAARPARLGHLLGTAPRGGAASCCDERRLCGAGRDAHACQSALGRALRGVFPPSPAAACFLVPLHDASFQRVKLYF